MSDNNVTVDFKNNLSKQLYNTILKNIQQQISKKDSLKWVGCIFGWIYMLGAIASFILVAFIAFYFNISDTSNNENAIKILNNIKFFGYITLGIQILTAIIKKVTDYIDSYIVNIIRNLNKIAKKYNIDISLDEDDNVQTPSNITLPNASIDLSNIPSPLGIIVQAKQFDEKTNVCQLPTHETPRSNSKNIELTSTTNTNCTDEGSISDILRSKKIQASSTNTSVKNILQRSRQYLDGDT